MIQFNYETTFQLSNEADFSNWVSSIIKSENKLEGEISYIFCDDEYLLKINQEHLQHDYYTDIISFDYSLGNEISGDMFISIDRVRENATDFKVNFDNELLRVMAHGILHYCGFSDKNVDSQKQMQQKENQKIAMFHVEQ